MMQKLIFSKHRINPIIRKISRPSESPDFSLPFLLYIIAWLLLPPPILNNFIPYSTPGGFLLFKFHPATWIFTIWLFTSNIGWPEKFFAISKENIVVLILSITLCSHLILLERFALLSTFIDIIVVPSIISKIILSETIKIRISLITNSVLIIIFFTAIALYIEVGTGFRFVEREGYDPYNRPGGWHGHPLAAATIILAGIILVGCRSSDADYPGIIIAIFLFGGIIISGTRGPLFVGGICIAIIFIKKMVYGNITGKLGIFTSFLVIIPTTLVYAAEFGAFDRFFSLGFDDDSAEARRGIWDVFYLLTKSELFFGISDYDVIADLALTTSGVPYVENAFVLVCLQSGVVAAIIYFIIVIWLCLSASRINISYGLVVLGAFLGTIAFATKGTAAPLIILTGTIVIAKSQKKQKTKLLK